MEELFKYFNIISKHANVYLDKALEPFGLCSCHRNFIKKIVTQPGITRDKLKTMVHIHPSNTSRIIDFLEEKDFIIKKINLDDKRICELYPTNNLLEVYNVLIKAEKEWIDIITKDYSEDEINKLSELLKRSAVLSIECIHKE